MKVRILRGQWCAVVLACAPPLAAAQTDTTRLDPPPLAALVPWADAVWLALLDRDGSYFGRLSDAGTFQRFNPLMDSEYALDIWTGLFTPAEDAQWAQADQGVRVAGASINHPFILNVADWRERVPIAGPVDLVARFVRQHSLTEQRDYPVVGVDWRDALGSAWTLRTTIGMHFFKSSADLEIGARRGPIELRVAFLDLFNNLIFTGLGVSPEETPAHFDYASPPLAARLALRTWVRPWRLELQAGGSTRSRVQVSFPASGDPPYTLVEQVWFAGGLGEVRASPRVGLAAYGVVAVATNERRFAPPGTADLSVHERTSAVGARGRVELLPSLALELDGRLLWRPEERRTGSGTLLSHNDREHFGQVALVRRPAVGWQWRLAIAALDRKGGVLAPALTAA
ncbi:MAG: hypothetical protein ACREMF_02195, partial [Gemmatimonadales bacterium]